ncbi:hypothetical protein ACIBBE_23845 [Streptomyces sp. NPDC051644]|uniref:hypothetical protein n=1 Tax=Streptomyces sp. NPDC051644 TaxID=3365666 RepID=UPI00378B88E1
MTAAAAQPNRSARAFGRVLRSLAQLGADTEHQVADVAHIAGLRPGHASRLLLTAVEEGFAEPGERYGAYRLTCDAAVLFGPAPVRTSTPEITETLRALHQDTNLAVAWHVPGWRPGTGLHLDLVDVVSPRPTLRADAAQQHHDLSRTAAGRIALAFLPPQMTSTADGRPLRLFDDLAQAVISSRIAASRTTSTRSLSTPVQRGSALVATLTVTGTPDQFADDLTVQEHAVLLRRAAARSSQSRAATHAI